MPADTNPAGDIFGGWLMSQMDLAAGNLAALTARGRAATVAVDGMRFHLPVKVGDEVSLFATVTRRGRTSMDIHVTAWRRSRHEDVAEKVTCATFAFVALDGEGRPRPIPADASGPREDGAPAREEARALLLSRPRSSAGESGIGR